MDNKKFESPEEVRAFLDPDAFANGFKKWLVNSEAVVGEVSRHLEPLVIGLPRLMEAVAVSDHRKTYFFGLSPTGHRSRQPRLWRGIGGNGSVQRLNRPQIEHRQRVGERRGAGELIVPPP